MADICQITLFTPGQQPKHYNLNAFGKDIVRMGRGPQYDTDGTPNDIQVDPEMRTVSRGQCYFQRDDQGNWYVVDNDSKNGLYFNNQRVKSHRLNSGDQLYIGSKAENRLVIAFTYVPQRSAGRPSAVRPQEPRPRADRIPGERPQPQDQRGTRIPEYNETDRPRYNRAPADYGERRPPQNPPPGRRVQVQEQPPRELEPERPLQAGQAPAGQASAPEGYDRAPGADRMPPSMSKTMVDTGNPEASLAGQSEASEIEDGFMSLFPLNEERQYLIGRLSECDIVIPHPTVSRKHCVITREGDRFFVEDNHSTNGVLLNSRLLTKREPLNPMDRINIGGTTLIFNGNSLLYRVQTGGVGISAERVVKRVGRGKNRKTILNDVSLTIHPNNFVAIIGGSGAGKTTLLNCISGMTDITSGNVFINGESIRTGGKNVRSLLGYVPQQDIVYDSLTLERMLYYSAKLRMPPDTSMKEIRQKIDETLEIVELSEHRKTFISKLSGGQKKRASIAVELLASPKVFFLDEPSSGLDPGTEKHLMQILKRLAMTGRTVVMVTHTVQNIDLCDGVICMGRGGALCYAGTPSAALRFFGKERMIDVYDELNDRAEVWARRFKELTDREGGAPVNNSNSEKHQRQRKRPRAQFRQFKVMTARYVEILLNSRMRFLLLMVMPMLLTLLVCLAFQADGNLQNLLLRLMAGRAHSIKRVTFPFLKAVDTMTLMFAFSCAVFWTGIFNSIQEISKERQIYERERFSGIGVVPYVFSKFVPLAALCVIQSIIMTAILSFMTTTTATITGNMSDAAAISMSMRPDGIILGKGMMWLETFLTTFLCALSAMCLGLLISTLVSNEMAMVLCPICLMPQILFSGIVTKLSGLTETLSNIISCKWSCVAYLVSARVNELYENVELGFEDNMSKYVTTPFSESNAVGVGKMFNVNKRYIFSKLLGLTEGDGVVSGWFVLFVISAVCVVGASLVLKFRRNGSRR